jgi:apolipoprotein N-acyltransferase
MRKSVRVGFSVLSGVLLAMPWYESMSGLVLLFAFLPLFKVEDFFYRNKFHYKSIEATKYAALTFFTWNFISTWWIMNASFIGLVMALLINTLLMSFIFWLFHLTKRRLGIQAGYFSMILYWLAFEYFYMNAEISWPWLNLGNGFAYDTTLVQWYEYTGILGGSLWVLLVNVLLYTSLRLYAGIYPVRKIRGVVGVTILLILAPVLLSLYLYRNYQENGKPREIVVVQPNIDPYKKFKKIPVEVQLDKMINLADSLVNDDTDYILFPETAIIDNIWEDNLSIQRSIRELRKFLEPYPNTTLVIGIISYKKYKTSPPPTPTARPVKNTGYYFDSFNTAIQLNASGEIPIYHKSKLVVGIEKMPYPKFLGFLKKLTVRLGGAFRSHGTQDYREVFYAANDSMGIAPVICYESVFGEFVTDYIKLGAGYIFILTNDGWWGNTPGHKQHHAFARLRAIETRRGIARSANTGISSFIDQRGDVLQQISWWKASAIKTTLKANEKITFYTRHGDFIGRTALFFSLMLLLYVIVSLFLPSKR